MQAAGVAQALHPTGFIRHFPFQAHTVLCPQQKPLFQGFADQHGSSHSLTALQGSGTSPQHSGQAAHSEQGTEVCSIPLFCILSICWQPACIAHEPQPQGLQCVGLWGLSTTAQGRGGDAGSDDADGSFGGSQSKQLMRSSLADQSGSYSLST